LRENGDTDPVRREPLDDGRTGRLHDDARFDPPALENVSMVAAGRSPRRMRSSRQFPQGDASTAGEGGASA
jgi:hypothetical protein